LALQTEFEFVLPKGYVDGEGNLHRTGAMRLARASDEILPMKDPRVKQNPAYLTVIVLSRVIVRLGEVEMITPKVVEELFSGDLAFLQDFYQRINQNGTAGVEIQCPKCEHKFEVESPPFGESQAIR
jgi:hypothetical protein